MPNDRYGTVGTGLGAGTGAGTVQVRYGYGTGTIHGNGRYGTWARKPYPCTVPMYCTDRTTQIAAEIVADLLLFLPLFGYMVRISLFGYMVRVRSVRYMGTVFVPMYRTDRTHVSYPYRTRTVPVPYLHPYPHPNPYQPSHTHLNSSARTPSAPYVMNPIENMLFVALEIS